MENFTIEMAQEELKRLSGEYDVPVPRLIIDKEECDRRNKGRGVNGFYFARRIVMRGFLQGTLYHEFRHHVQHIRWRRAGHKAPKLEGPFRAIPYYERPSEVDAMEFSKREMERRGGQAC